MTNAKKSLITIKMVDLFGNPIAKLEYQVKNQRSGEVIAAGPTNSAGCIVEISRDKGTVIDVYIKNMFTGKMGKVQSFVMSRDRMLVKITSPKVLLDLKTILDQGSDGQYKRKTHTVKQGETLTSIASKNHTTVRALERLNKIDDPNKIHIGQVLKLPVNIPATGSNTHQDKPKPKPPTTSTKPKVAPKTQTPKVSNKTTPQSKESSGVLGTLGDLGNQALEQANDLYEEGKKTFNNAVGSVTKILTVDDRSQEGGTPKSNAPNLCKTNPQCIDKGPSEFIREVNIRLAGFGGALPTDEFTELTAKCIKQFQKDYMGVPETGKICGSVLVALDKFSKEYPIDNYLNQMKCPCKSHGGGKQCDGFGAGRTKQYYKKDGKKGNFAIENKGMHRSVVWVFKATCFYINKIDKKQFTINKIDSGYRCIENNDGHNGSNEKRTTINHMGLAFDLHFNKNGNRTREEADMNLIRSALFGHYMDGSTVRRTNKIYLEPAWYGQQKGATTWVHFDFTRFEGKFLSDHFFAKTVEKLNGDSLLNLAKKQGLDKILSCSGGVVSQPTQPTLKDEKKLFDENDAKVALKVIYDTYGEDIALIVEKMYRGETTHFRSQQYKYCGTPGMEVGRKGTAPAPYYGWDGNLFIEAPTGTWSAYEGEGLSKVGGNAQVTKSKKIFVCVSSVLVGMTFVAKYIQKYNGNYARWFSDKAPEQAVYREHMGKIKARIVPTFK